MEQILQHVGAQHCTLEDLLGEDAHDPLDGRRLLGPARLRPEGFELTPQLFRPERQFPEHPEEAIPPRVVSPVGQEDHPKEHPKDLPEEHLRLQRPVPAHGLLELLQLSRQVHKLADQPLDPQPLRIAVRTRKLPEPSKRPVSVSQDRVDLELEKLLHRDRLPGNLPFAGQHGLGLPGQEHVERMHDDLGVPEIPPDEGVSRKHGRGVGDERLQIVEQRQLQLSPALLPQLARQEERHIQVGQLIPDAKPEGAL